MPKKKLAIITTHPIQYYAPLFRMLTERGNVAVKVFYTWGDDVLKDKYDPGFKRVVTWDIPLLEGYDYSFPQNIAADKGSHHFAGIDNPGLITDIKKWHADALLVIGWSYKSHLRVLRYFKGKIPVLFRGDSTLLDEPPGFSIKKILRKQVLKRVYGYIDKALYVGTNNKAYYNKFGVKDSKLIYAPHAIDNSRFSASEADYEQQAADLRETLGITKEDVVFLFAGKLEPKKAPELLIKAFLALNAPDTFLVIAGNGESEAELKALASGYNNIRFIGFQNQSRMPVVYRLGNVFVLPSKGPDETWGLAINEAMASGRPVIASDKCGGAIDLIIPGQNGYMFSAGNTDALTAALANCVKQKAELEKMGINARMHVTCNFSFEGIVAAVEQCLK